MRDARSLIKDIAAKEDPVQSDTFKTGQHQQKTSRDHHTVDIDNQLAKRVTIQKPNSNQ